MKQPVTTGNQKVRRVRVAGASASLDAVIFAATLLGAMTALALVAQSGTPSAQGSAASNEPGPRQTGTVVMDDEVVLAVGGIKVTAAQFRQILQSLPPQFQAVYSQLGMKGFAEQYASLLGLSQEAEKRGIDQSEDFRRMFDFERRVVLAQVMANQITATAGSVSDEEVSYYFTTHESEFEQVRVRGIYLPINTAQTRATVGTPGTGAKPQYSEQMAQRRALQIRSLIMNGMGDMATLAKNESDHPTAAKGGDFGFIRRGDLPPSISNTVFGMQLHQVSAPLRDKTGFFVFRMEGKRLEPLEEVKEGIRTALSLEKLTTYLNQIRESYPVTYHPTYFTTPEAQNKPPATPSAQPGRSR